MVYEEDVKKAIKEVFENKRKRHAKLLGIVAIVAIGFVLAVFGIFFVQAKSTFVAEDIAFVSQADLDFQARVENITGYDWITILNSKGDNNSKAAALMLLANEISVLDDQYNFVNRSVGVSKDEFSALNLKRMNASDTSKRNVLKLIDNVKAVEEFYKSKNLTSAQIRINRLRFLSDFFNKFGLPEGDLSFDESEIFGDVLGLSVDDFDRAIALAIIRYNLFVESV